MRTMIDLTANENFRRYALMVKNGEMTFPALNTLYSNQAGKEAIAAAYRAVTDTQEPQTAKEIRSADLVASFMGDTPEPSQKSGITTNEKGDESGDSEKSEISYQSQTLCSQDESVEMDIVEAKEADRQAVQLYGEGQRISRRFLLHTYWIYTRKGWRKLGFDSWENYYKSRFPELHVKNSYPLMKEQGVRLRIEAVAEEVPAVLKLPAAAVMEIAKLPEDQQGEAARLTVEMAKNKVVHGAGAKFNNPDKPSTMDAKRVVAEMTGAPPPISKPSSTRHKGEGTPFLTDSETAQIALLRTVRDEHLFYEPNTRAIRINMCEEAYRDARYLELPLLVLIGILESQSYTVTWRDPFGDSDDGETAEMRD